VTGTKNAEVIEQLCALGASTLATAVMVPYACGASAQNANFPRLINPLEESYAVGGSSSGSAVAVAAGLTPISLGTDTTGSVRIPAASCGILGLKTSAGLIATEGVRKLAPTLDTVGFLAYHLQDIELLLEYLALKPLLPSFTTSEMPAIKMWLPDCVDSMITTAITSELSNKISWQLIEIAEFENLKEQTDQLLSYEANALYAQDLDQPWCPRTLKTLCKLGREISATQYASILTNKENISHTFIEKYFAHQEILLLPNYTCSLPNWNEVEIGHPDFQKDKLMGLFTLMGFVNFLGLPSLSIPIGRDANGRPLSIQAISRPFSELRLLKFASQIYVPWDA
jgi:aspartyl-tRNA(Asn)/glutamyl-tRNA(Gln) amidotransferase subunit A